MLQAIFTALQTRRINKINHLLLLMAMSLLANQTTWADSLKMTSAGKLAGALIDELAPADGPGIQYIIVDKDKIVFEHSAGLADIENKTPLSMNHTMAAFSMTKTITAIAILQLAEKQKLNIDDEAAKYITHPYSPEITIRQLLNHTSGIPNPIPLRWVHAADSQVKFDEGNALALVLKDNARADHAPGASYAYTNIGYWLLGKVIEAVARQDYESYVTQHIFLPLKLKPSQIAFVINDLTNHAKGYLAKYSFMNFFKGFVIDKDVWGEYEGSWLHIRNVYLNGPAFGGTLGSARAFSRILQDLLSNDSILLGNNAKQLLYSQQKNNSGKNIDMTLGWHIGDLNGIGYFYKEGGGAGFHSEMRIYPAAGLASVIMTNRTSFDSTKQLSKLDRNFVR